MTFETPCNYFNSNFYYILRRRKCKKKIKRFSIRSYGQIKSSFSKYLYKLKGIYTVSNNLF